MPRKPQKKREIQIAKSPSNMEIQISELHGTKDDKISEGWLAAAIRTFLPKDVDTYSQAAASAFARTSTCCIHCCQNRVEVGAHVAVDGKRLFIIPTCKAHNGVGVLDKLGAGARLKRNTIYLKVSLPKGKKIELVNGKFMFDIQESPEDILRDAEVFDALSDDEEDDE